MTDAGPVFLGSEIYRRSSYGGWHPLRVPRVSTVMDLSRALGWLPRDRFRTSPRAKPAALAAWHRPDYLAALQRAEAAQAVTEAERAAYGLGTPSNPVFAEMYRRPATAAGASILAGELLARGGVVYSPAGGTHHGLPGRAAGFCYLNDPVLAILSLRAHGARRVAYVDIDAHHCDGVEAAFADDPEALLVSVHEERRWPFTGALEEAGAGQVYNLPVPRGLNDSEMRAVLQALILPAVAGFAPDAVVLQCGADALEEDPLSRLALSNNVHCGVVAALRPLAPRYLVLGGGGYNPWAVGRCWTGVWGTLLGAELPDRLPAEAEAVLRAVEWRGNSRARNPAAALFETLRDAPREGAVRAELRDRLAVLEARVRAAALRWV
ncbi:acetoin utilization protein AcuC [Psychromarinibacter sp. C21-152]|uniref:Acetoin utilization protein AcuC n=1 Tax=Psychromarinibacter sediminicola TaxID=3033385 RepID=A0AAE3NQ73_9RHOB|nr:acetoin utilization protein AcuC [Psychromarinibacter sediminicola]MDF0600411.1 acetoin utilization protein AcuC [Psychromarinibacter sediminicola]